MICDNEIGNSQPNDYKCVESSMCILIVSGKYTILTPYCHLVPTTCSTRLEFIDVIITRERGETET